MSHSIEIVGRSSSHFTRVARIFAHTLGVPYELVVVSDLLATDAAEFGGNPALTLPTLRIDGTLLFGTENICRRLSKLADREVNVVWPEDVTTDIGRNAQELTWTAMSAQVQLILGRSTGRDAADPFMAKREAGLRGALAWLDANFDDALAALPEPRDASLFEITLFCLIEHLQFRRTLPVDPYGKLLRFAEIFSSKDAARRTVFQFDARGIPGSTTDPKS